MGIAGPVYAARQEGKAADAQIGAARETAAEAGRQYDTTRRDTAPYRQVGAGALGMLAQLYGLPTPQTMTDDQTAALAPKQVGDTLLPGNAELTPLGGGRYNVSIGGQQIGQLVPGGKAGKFIGNGTPIPSLNPQQQPGMSQPAATGTGQPDMSVFQESPDYQFNLAEGQKALDRSLTARGRGLSGAAVREGTRYASGMASNEFGNFYNRLASLAGIGQTGVSQSSQAGQVASGQIGAATMAGGNARASGYRNIADIYRQSSNNTASNLGTMFLMGG